LAVPGAADPAPSIVLIGLRCAGKSLVGARLAERLGRPFVELDAVTSGLLGARSAGEALLSAGAAAFRAAETEALRLVLGAPGRVVALGGGTPTAPGAADLLRRERASGTALVVYLRLPADTLRRRLAATGPADRPSVTGLGTIEEVDRLLAERDPLYASLASLTIAAEGLSPEEAAERIAASVAAGA
jgi:shikimate kinase